MPLRMTQLYSHEMLIEKYDINYHMYENIPWFHEYFLQWIKTAHYHVPKTWYQGTTSSKQEDVT